MKIQRIGFSRWEDLATVSGWRSKISVGVSIEELTELPKYGVTSGSPALLSDSGDWARSVKTIQLGKEDFPDQGLGRGGHGAWAKYLEMMTRS
ncbi:MAG: hypothetical protein ABIT37_20165 [Luteolibacter sp.]